MGIVEDSLTQIPDSIGLRTTLGILEASFD